MYNCEILHIPKLKFMTFLAIKAHNHQKPLVIIISETEIRIWMDLGFNEKIIIFFHQTNIDITLILILNTSSNRSGCYSVPGYVTSCFECFDNTCKTFNFSYLYLYGSWTKNYCGKVRLHMSSQLWLVEMRGSGQLVCCLLTSSHRHLARSGKMHGTDMVLQLSWVQVTEAHSKLVNYKIAAIWRH